MVTLVNCTCKKFEHWGIIYQFFWIKTGIAVDQENYQAESDLTIDTGYFGDIDTSSGNLSLQSKSDSDDDNSEISFEGITLLSIMIRLLSNSL